MADKSMARRMYENVMGTPEQNAEAEKRMEDQDKKNPDTAQAKLNRATKKVSDFVSDAGVGARNAGRLYGKSIGMDVGPYEKERGMKSGGKVSSASSRADGIAQRGKTRGKMC
jgi:hypothetical protein